MGVSVLLTTLNFRLIFASLTLFLKILAIGSLLVLSKVVIENNDGLTLFAVPILLINLYQLLFLIKRNFSISYTS